MKKSLMGVFVPACFSALIGCANNPANNEVSYEAYQPGYTGYTVGAGAYNIPNGYGPAFWSPGYYNYTGYDTNTREYGRICYPIYSKNAKTH